MGLFSVKVIVAHPTEPARAAEVDFLVDTGARLSWIPRELVDRLQMPRLARRPFLLADGRSLDRETAVAILRLDGVQAAVTVVVAEAGDAHLLGATSLESLGFGVDPVSRRLYPQNLLVM